MWRRGMRGSKDAVVTVGAGCATRLAGRRAVRTHELPALECSPGSSMVLAAAGRWKSAARPAAVTIGPCIATTSPKTIQQVTRTGLMRDTAALLTDPQDDTTRISSSASQPPTSRFLIIGASNYLPNPIGIVSQSPGLRRPRRHPGNTNRRFIQPRSGLCPRDIPPPVQSRAAASAP
jgi:hypothetical protein